MDLPTGSLHSLTAMMSVAAGHHEAGRLAEAEAIYRQVLALEPDHAEALHSLGILATQVGQPSVAAELFHRSVLINPQQADAWTNLGNAWQACGRLEEGIQAHRHAIALRPNFALGWNNLGASLHREQRLEEAIEAFKAAVNADPLYAAAWSNLGQCLKTVGLPAEAIAAHRTALEISPTCASFHHNLADAFAANGQVEESISAYREALRLDSRLFKTWNALGNTLFAGGKVQAAIDCYRQAAHANPNFAAAFSNLGHALWRAGSADEAVATCQEAIRLDPSDAAAHNNLGCIFCDLRRIDEAIRCCEEAARLDPSLATAQNNLGDCLLIAGLAEEASSYFRKAVDLGFSPGAQSNLVYAAHFSPKSDSAALLEEGRLWDRCHGQSLKPSTRRVAARTSTGRRLRIGYVSPYFRRHVVGQNLRPLLRGHDHSRFEIFCYSYTTAPDALTEELRASSDHWRDIREMSDARAAELIQADEIDILVDLTMHMSWNRLPIFARQPAPIQVCYLAYCSTTGLEAMDFRVSDPYFDPPGSDLSVYSEETVRLPRTYWCYEPLVDNNTVPGAPSPAEARDFVTFGCLNNLAKVSNPALNLWGEILCALPTARLLLHAPEGSCRSRIWDHLAQCGVDHSRVSFVGMQPAAEYMATWRRIDIGLDPFPYAGGITTCDALWMGTPVVTLTGKTAVGRGGCSILSNIGLPELIAADERQYLEIAVGLAHDPKRRATLRGSLRERIERSPLRDPDGFARDVEEAFRMMWKMKVGTFRVLTD